MINKDYLNVIKNFESANSIAIFMHINPDCDCIGSAIALYAFLKKIGKKVSFFSPDFPNIDSISSKYNFLPFFDKFNENANDSYDLSVGVDLGSAGRLGDNAFKKFIKSKKNLVIDHHALSEDFAQFTLRESDAASTTQILYKIMKFYDETKIDKDIATLLYAGIVTDSGGFSYDNTTSETHKITSELLTYNINSSYIYSKLIKEINLNIFNLKNIVLSNAKFYENNRIGIIVFKNIDFEKTNTCVKDTEGIINNLTNIIDVDLAIAISEISDKNFKISFRSKNNVNAAACANCFGGGGHFRAAGCRVNGYFDNIYDKILNVAKEMIYND